jgi:hypothetical protein
MSTSSIPASSPHLEVDVVADIVDQFYLNPSQESVNAEYVSHQANNCRATDLSHFNREREDICFYNLYDHRTPKPYPKSPDLGQCDLSANKPFDQDLLALKLRNCMAFVSPCSKIESMINTREVIEHTEQGSATADGAAEVGLRGQWDVGNDHSMYAPLTCFNRGYGTSCGHWR